MAALHPGPPRRKITNYGWSTRLNGLVGDLWWDEEDAEHIRTRSVRYSRADDIEPSWTLEAEVLTCLEVVDGVMADAESIIGERLSDMVDG